MSAQAVAEPEMTVVLAGGELKTKKEISRSLELSLELVSAAVLHLGKVVPNMGVRTLQGFPR